MNDRLTADGFRFVIAGGSGLVLPETRLPQCRGESFRSGGHDRNGRGMLSDAIPVARSKGDRRLPSGDRAGTAVRGRHFANSRSSSDGARVDLSATTCSLRFDRHSCPERLSNPCRTGRRSRMCRPSRALRRPLQACSAPSRPREPPEQFQGNHGAKSHGIRKSGRTGLSRDSKNSGDATEIPL